MDRRTLLRYISGTLALLTLAPKATADEKLPTSLDHFLRDDLPDGALPIYDCRGILYTLCRAPDDLTDSPLRPGALFVGGYDTTRDREYTPGFTVPLVHATSSELERFACEMLEAAANWTMQRKALPGERLHVGLPAEYIGRYVVANDGRVGLMLYNHRVVSWAA